MYRVSMILVLVVPRAIMITTRGVYRLAWTKCLPSCDWSLVEIGGAFRA